MMISTTITHAIGEIDHQRQRAETWKRLALEMIAATKDYDSQPFDAARKTRLCKARVAVLSQRQTEDGFHPTHQQKHNDD